MSTIDIEVDRSPGHLFITWRDRRGQGSCRFDHVPGTSPEWLGSADELLEGTTRQQERRVLDAVASWADAEGLELGIWHDDQGVEMLTSGHPG